MEHGTGMTESQCAELHERGYLILPGLLPRAAIQPLTDDLAAAVEQEVEQLVIWERLDRAATFADEPFEPAPGRGRRRAGRGVPRLALAPVA